MKVVCLGNPHVRGDDLAAGLCGKLQKDGIDAKMADGIDTDLFGNEKVVFVDVAKGLSQARFVSPGELETSRTATAHDIDAGFYFRMMEKMGRKVKIIGIPYGMEEKKALAEVKKLLASSLASSSGDAPAVISSRVSSSGNAPSRRSTGRRRG